MTTMTNRRIINSITDADLIQLGFRCAKEINEYLPSAALLIEQLALRLAYEIKRREERAL